MNDYKAYIRKSEQGGWEWLVKKNNNSFLLDEGFCLTKWAAIRTAKSVIKRKLKIDGKWEEII